MVLGIINPFIFIMVLLGYLLMQKVLVRVFRLLNRVAFGWGMILGFCFLGQVVEFCLSGLTFLISFLMRMRSALAFYLLKLCFGINYDLAFFSFWIFLNLCFLFCFFHLMIVMVICFSIYLILCCFLHLVLLKNSSIQNFLSNQLQNSLDFLNDFYLILDLSFYYLYYLLHFLSCLIKLLYQMNDIKLFK